MGLSKDKLKLVVLLQENPPGRIIYHNQKQPWRTLPSLNNYIDNFKGNEDNKGKKQFLDYSD